MLPSLDQMSKGQFGNVQRVLDTVCNEDDWRRAKFMLQVMDFDHTPTMMEMCVKYGPPFVAVLKRNQEMKKRHAESKRGYWVGKNIMRTRYTAEIPVEIAGNPKNPLYWQYFHPDMHDPMEKRKYLYQFLRKYDMAFAVVERL